MEQNNMNMKEYGESVEGFIITADNERMIEEVGDVLVMIDLIKKRGLLKSKDLESRMKVKKEKLKKWSNLLG